MNPLDALAAVAAAVSERQAADPDGVEAGGVEAGGTVDAGSAVGGTDPVTWWRLAGQGWLPAAPLIEQVERNGGLRACGIRREAGGEAERLAKAYYRGRAKGRIRLYLADMLAVRALCQHPALIWGDLWWKAALVSLVEDRPSRPAASRARVQVSAVPAESSGRPMRWVDVARLALSATAAPMTARDILDWNDTDGPRRPHSGRTPVRTINRDLHVAVRRGEPGLVHGDAPGTFVLAA